MAPVVVLGAGVAGLGTALALGRSGHEVVLVERDDVGRAADPEEAFAARGRRGAPQTRHSHAFLARMRLLLAARAPDVLAALMAAGATELRFLEDLPAEMEGFTPEPGDEDLVAIACRRTTFEWVLRRTVMEGGHTRLVHGSAVGVTVGTGPDGLPAVTGAVLAAGERLEGVAVVDALGRRSPMDRWLAEAGGQAPRVRSADTGIIYSTRFYRLRPGAEPPAREGPIGGDLGYMKYAIFMADNDTFSITFAVPVEDPELRALLHEPAFDRAARAMPATRAWVAGEVAAPITGVEVMARLVNRKVDYVNGGRPVATGVYAVGDSHVCTNPIYGRGCSLAMVHAHLLADVLGAHPPGSVEAALAFDRATSAELVPWYDAAVAQDAAAVRNDNDPGEPSGRRPGNLVTDGLLPAARRHPRVMRAFLRAFNLLDPPLAALSDPEVLALVMQAFEERETRRSVPLGPGRGELLAAVS